MLTSAVFAKDRSSLPPNTEGTLNRMAKIHAKLQNINLTYRRDVMPIFEKKCFDCHSGRTHYPFYYKLPFVRSMIDADITEARAALDLSSEFPFGGHGLFSTDLPKIRLEIEEGEMPPFFYRVMHQGSAVTEEERKRIFNWVDESQKSLLQNF